MARFRVVVTDQVFPDVELERRLLSEIDAELEVADGTIDDVLRRGRDADGLLNTYLPLGAAAIGELRNCRIVARYGIGVDNIDLDAATDAGIVVTNVPDYCVEEVAAHALTLILALVRKLPDADRFVRHGGWGLDGVRPIRRLSELTVGLVGYGRIARRLGATLRSIGMSIIAHDPYIQPDADTPPLVDLDELLRRSDVVSVHAPLTGETRGMIAAPQLRAMPEHAVLVNTSRGALVVFDDLVDALADGQVRAAALDVFEHEPPPAEVLAGVPNLLCTPHIAFYSEDAIAESQRKAASQVIKVLTGDVPDYDVR
jgi:D-3-phosphoglycerate dehydrogenase